MMTTSLWNCGVSTYGKERMNKWSTWSPFSIKHIPFDLNQCTYFPETIVGDSISEWTSVYREDYSRLGVTFNSPFDPHVLVRPFVEFLPPAPGPQPILLTSKAPGGHPHGAVMTARLLSSVPAPVYLLGWCPCPRAGLCGLTGTGASLHITVGPLSTPSLPSGVRLHFLPRWSQPPGLASHSSLFRSFNSVHRDLFELGVSHPR